MIKRIHLLLAGNIQDKVRKQQKMISISDKRIKDGTELGQVIGVEHLREVFGRVLILHGTNVGALVEILELAVARRLGRPETHVVYGVRVVSWHGRIVGHGHYFLGVDPVEMGLALLVLELDHAAPEFHWEEQLGAWELPMVAVTQPVVGVLHWVAVFDFLIEQTVLIADAIAIPRGKLRVAMESRKQAASLPSPPFPNAASCSNS